MALGVLFVMKGELGFVDIMGGWTTVPALKLNYGGVYKGLTIILQKGFNKVIVETDAQEVVKLLEEGPGDKHPYKGLVEDARNIFNGCQCVAQHVYREGNLCADALAKLGAAQPEDILVVNNAPAEIRDLLVVNMLGMGREKA
ncbi:uncharacterized protein LOC114314462 [Camellia sinensis]|uniref:uncharacterized protein LOC114314462 n=1 Tax=Camellia sinensis TaxID=4442 RepID=UPI001035A4F4|nr:uncharacterized protein LOC114314462 [Camellia sinensis]